MKYFLDTHSFLWSVFDDDKLPRTVTNILKNPDNDIYVSVVSYFEISLKYTLGKIELEGVMPDETWKSI